MVKFSRYTHVFELDDAVALYHSLRMKPVYLNKESYEDLQKWLASPFSLTLADAPENIKNEVIELAKYKILTKTGDEDDKVLEFVKTKIPAPMVNVCYMILSEQCNLACKYCFLGNNNDEKRNNFQLESMTKETAEKAIEFFVRQINLSGLENYEDNKPVIIFYGGEPLVNYDVLVYIANRVNEMRSLEPCLRHAELSMVTNGLLLNDKRILELNSDHPLIDALGKVDSTKVSSYAKLLYNQALLIEGFTIEDPIEFSNSMAQLMIDASK